MTIDENYTERLVNAVTKTLVEALENLTIADVNMYRLGYTKAIDDFAETLKSDEFQKYNIDMVFETSRDLTYTQCTNAFCEYVDSIAEQLKAGGVDE